MGIPASERARIFDRGARLDTGKPGTGLGLAIVRDVAEIYGGSVDLGESEDLGGLLVKPDPAAARSARLPVTAGSPFVVADDLIDDEAQEFFAEFGVQFAFLGQPPQPCDLFLFARSDRRAAAMAVFALYSPTACVMRNRSASMWISAASILSMLLRKPASVASSDRLLQGLRRTFARLTRNRSLAKKA